MKLVWYSGGWDDYCYRQEVDRKIVKKINTLIRDTLRHPTEGMGKPEALKYELAGAWSRRITDEHRLVYVFDEDSVTIIACRHHY